MAKKKSIKPKLRKKDTFEAKVMRQLLDMRLSIRSLQWSVDNPDVEISRVEALRPEEGDIIVLSVSNRSIDEMSSILHKYKSAFNRRGLELVVTDGSCEVSCIRKSLSSEP